MCVCVCVCFTHSLTHQKTENTPPWLASATSASVSRRKKRQKRATIAHRRPKSPRTAARRCCRCEHSRLHSFLYNFLFFSFLFFFFFFFNFKKWAHFFLPAKTCALPHVLKHSFHVNLSFFLNNLVKKRINSYIIQFHV